MALKTIDLRKVKPKHRPNMSREDYRAQLAMNRGKRPSMEEVPSDMVAPPDRLVIAFMKSHRAIPVGDD